MKNQEIEKNESVGGSGGLGSNQAVIWYVPGKQVTLT